MKKIRKFFAATALIMAALPGMADINTPYSMYGYGIIGDRATSMQRQMGGVGYAMNSGRQINVMNPASYAAVDSLTFLFDMGAGMSSLWSKEGSAREQSFGGGLDYVTMQFPLCKYMGASIGMLPYSAVGYAFGNELSHGTMENQGSGGINQAYLGLAGTYAGLSLGVNVAYNFGTIKNDIYSTPSNSGQSLLEHIMQIRDWDINIGVQYKYRIDRFNNMTVGVTYAPKKSLHGKSWATVQELTQDSKPDTIGYLGLKNNYYTPASYGFGIGYRHEKISRFVAEFDVTWQQWSKAAFSEMKELPSVGAPGHVPATVFQGMDFYDRLKYALGLEYVPKVRGSYGERIAYRIGGYFCNDYLNIMGNRMREYGVSCGVGLNAPSDKTMINIGLEWKHRSAHPVTLISENYLNITIGVNFNEVWFWQRKIR